MLICQDPIASNGPAVPIHHGHVHSHISQRRSLSGAVMLPPLLSSHLLCAYRELSMKLQQQGRRPDVPSQLSFRPAHPRCKAIVIGAGPTGALAALMLAQNNYDVEVYEQRPQEGSTGSSSPRSYALVLSIRGLRLIEKVGIDLSMFHAFPYRGIVNGNNEAAMTFFHDPINSKVLVERSDLVRQLTNEVQRLAPRHSVKFIWDTKFMGMDVEKQLVRLQKRDGECMDVDYDVLIGADGIHSRVRQELNRLVPSFHVKWLTDRQRVEKYFHDIPPPDFEDGKPRPPYTELERESAVLRFALLDNPDGLKLGFFHIFNHPDGTYSGGIQFVQSGTGDGRENIRTEDDYLAAFRTLQWYPKEFLQCIAKQLASRPWYTTGNSVEVSSLHVGRILFLGDAAHAISPVMGQGCNAAIEDCTVLGTALATYPDDLDAALHMYERLRLPDIRALAQLDKECLAYTGRLGRLNPIYIKYKVHLALHGALHKVLPQRYGEPELGSMTTVQGLPYSTALGRINTAKVVLWVAAAALAVVCSRGRRLL